MKQRKEQFVELRGLLRTAILDNDSRPEYEKKQAKKYIKMFGGQI